MTDHYRAQRDNSGECQMFNKVESVSITFNESELMTLLGNVKSAQARVYVRAQHTKCSRVKKSMQIKFSQLRNLQEKLEQGALTF